MTGNEELKHQGERILDGTDAPSTFVFHLLALSLASQLIDCLHEYSKKKIEEVTGQSASQVNIQTQS